MKNKNKQKNELLVVQWLATTDKDLKEQRMTKLRNLGNYYHNANVLQKNEGTIITVYRPTEDADYRNYLPCSDCFGYYAKRDLWKHGCKMEKEKNDGQPKTKKRKAYVKMGRCMLPVTGMSQKVHEICAGLRSDEDGVSAFIKGDSLMLKLADKFAFKLGHDDGQYSYIRAKLREVGRMVLQYRKSTGLLNASLADVIHPEKFQDVIKATRYVSGFNDSTHIYRTPSLALKIGHSLKKAASILLGEALTSSDENKEKRAKQFITLLELQWTEKVSSHALRTLNENKRNNPKYLPVTEDVMKLTDYMKDKLQRDVETLKTAKARDMGIPAAYRELSEVTLASVLVFNRKRSGEVSRMKMVDFDKCEKGNAGGNITEGLSEFERRLCGVLWRMEIRGKKGRNVPVLLVQDIKDSMELLRSVREDAGVHHDNLFFFAMKSGGYVRGCDVLRKYSKLCGATNPEYLRSTRLRQHIGTVCQVMNLKENEQDILASFMGHDLRIHREFYRLPERTLQLAKVSKVLLQLQAGNIGNLAGRTMEEVDVQLDEEGKYLTIKLVHLLKIDNGLKFNWTGPFLLPSSFFHCFFFFFFRPSSFIFFLL